MAARIKVAKTDPLAVAPPAATPETTSLLEADKFRSVDDLKNEIMQSITPQPGEKPEDAVIRTYQKMFDLLGREREDDVKKTLSNVLQGVAGSLFDLYRLFQDAGLATPLDEKLIEEFKTRNPSLMDNEQKKKETSNTDGLHLPPMSASTNGKMQKTAGGRMYIVNKEDDQRLCPKALCMVDRYICRFHCLDGLPIGKDVACGEVVWRNSVMDKFSPDYIEKRFEVTHNDGGHPAGIPDGKRANPLHENARIIEKRLADERKDEDKYNFDSYKAIGGPKIKASYNKSKTVTAEESLLGDPFSDDWQGDAPHDSDIGKLADDAMQAIQPAGHGEEQQVDVQVQVSGPVYKQEEGQWIAVEGSGTHGTKVETKQIITQDGKNPECDIVEIDNSQPGGGGIYGVPVQAATPELKPEPEQELPVFAKSKSFNLKKMADAMTDAANGSLNGSHGNLNDGPRGDTTPKQVECTKCKMRKNIDDYRRGGVCQNPNYNETGRPCGGSQFAFVYPSQDGGAPKGSGDLAIKIKAATGVSLHYACGVYKATKGSVSTYGVTVKEAADKLDQKINAPSIGNLEQGMQNILQKQQPTALPGQGQPQDQLQPQVPQAQPKAPQVPQVGQEGEIGQQEGNQSGKPPLPGVPAEITTYEKMQQALEGKGTPEDVAAAQADLNGEGINPEMLPPEQKEELEADNQLFGV